MTAGAHDGTPGAPGGVRVLIAGGGTGGHLTPALALARELERRGATVFLVGTPRGPDRRALPASGLEHRLLEAPAVERARWWRNVALPVALARAVLAARRIVAGFRPAVVVGTGGYVTVPVVLAARARGIPVLLQEQNRVPGLATRLLARWAEAVCVQFAEAADALGDARVVVTGSPIHPPAPAAADFADRLDPNRPTVGVFGGSQGARALNDAVLDLVGGGPEAAPFNLVWQTGAADHARVDAAGPWPARFVVRPFFDRMDAVYPRLDLVVCRAGALTLAEVTAWGIPSVLVPYPHAAADHQAANARAMAEAGAAIHLAQAELESRRLGNLVRGLLDDAARRTAMADAARRLGRPDAAAAVAERVLALAGAA